MKARFPFLLLASVASVFAASGASAAEVRIGYVDLQKALALTDEGKSAKDRLKKDFDGKQKKLDQAQEELKKDKETYDKQSAMWNEEKKREFQLSLERKLAETTQMWQQMQRDLSEAEAKATNEIFAKMEVIIHQIAETEGFTHVFDRKQSGLIYAPESMDLTAELVRKFNDRHPLKKQAAATSSPKTSDGAAKKDAPKK